MRYSWLVSTIFILALPALAFAQTDEAAPQAQHPLARKAPLRPVIVHDAATAKAMRASQTQVLRISKNCANSALGKKGKEDRSKATECLCAHAEELAHAYQLQSDALVALLDKNPDLKDKRIRVRGVSGKIILNSQIVKNSNAESIRKQYQCR